MEIVNNFCITILGVNILFIQKNYQFLIICINFLSHCNPGIKGVICDILLVQGDSLCSSNPCWNGGTCQNLGNDFACACPPGYYISDLICLF